MEVIQNNNTVPQGEDLSVWGYFVRCITKKYSDFSGRARRKEWWSYILFQLLIFIVPVVLFVATTVGEMMSDPDTMQYMSQNPDDEEYIYSLMSGNVYFWAMMIVELLLLVPWLAVTCRRFHDVGISSGLFWVVGGLTILINVIGLLALIEPGVVPHAVTSIYNILSPLVGLVILVIAFIPGKIGPNAYGPDPKPAPTYEGYGQI
nr:DUF805 domain-containing protein [uncultured Porphyromonas sp.]